MSVALYIDTIYLGCYHPEGMYRHPFFEVKYKCEYRIFGVCVTDFGFKKMYICGVRRVVELRLEPHFGRVKNLWFSQRNLPAPGYPKASKHPSDPSSTAGMTSDNAELQTSIWKWIKFKLRIAPFHLKDVFVKKRQKNKLNYLICKSFPYKMSK